MPFDCELVKQKVAVFVAKGVFIDKSSRKYEGRFGMLYDEQCNVGRKNRGVAF